MVRWARIFLEGGEKIFLLRRERIYLVEDGRIYSGEDGRIYLGEVKEYIFLVGERIFLVRSELNIFVRS